MKRIIWPLVFAVGVVVALRVSQPEMGDGVLLATGVVALVLALVQGRTRSRAHTRRTSPPPAAPLPGWAMVTRDDSIARNWAGHPHLPSSGLWNVWRGRAHHRPVTVFQTARTDPADTFMVFPMPLYSGPSFVATSTGPRSVSLAGAAPTGLSDLLDLVGPGNFRRLGVADGTFWMDLGPMSQSRVQGFISRRAPELTRMVNKTLPRDRAGGGQKASPPRTPEPVRAADAIMQTPPVEVQQRPALKPAEPSPIARSLENPDLAAEWQPAQWTAPSSTLDAPMGLGPTPPAGEALQGGWKPREWTPPDYGSSAAAAWRPAEPWTPNYDTGRDA